jgi:2-methylcitrate dehydratase PrpD
MREGLKAEDVDRVIVKMTEDAVLHSFWTPYLPVGLTAAQMHLGFCIGMKLIDGEVFVDQMVEENIGRPDILQFCKRVDVVRDEEREKRGRPFARGADVEVLLRNGTRIRKVVDNFLGSFQRPMSDEQMAVKFRKLAEKSLPATKVSELEKIVRNLESYGSVAELLNVLRGTESRA